MDALMNLLRFIPQVQLNTWKNLRYMTEYSYCATCTSLFGVFWSLVTGCSKEFIAIQSGRRKRQKKQKIESLKGTKRINLSWFQMTVELMIQ